MTAPSDVVARTYDIVLPQRHGAKDDASASLTSRAERVLAVLREHDGEVLTYAAIAALAGVSRITARRAVEDIERERLVVRIRATSSCRGFVGHYYYLITRAEQTTPEAPPRVSTRDGIANRWGEHPATEHPAYTRLLLSEEDAKETHEKATNGSASPDGRPTSTTVATSTIASLDCESEARERYRVRHGHYPGEPVPW